MDEATSRVKKIWPAEALRFLIRRPFEALFAPKRLAECRFSRILQDLFRVVLTSVGITDQAHTGTLAEAIATDGDRN